MPVQAIGAVTYENDDPKLRRGRSLVTAAAQPLSVPSPARTMPELVIDPEVASWLPSRTPEERAALERRAEEIVNEPILVWRRGDQDVVLEDADVVELLRGRALRPRVKRLEFASEEEARCYVLDRQLERRNLSGLRLRYVEGARYNLERSPGRRTDLTSPQDDGRSESGVRSGSSRATRERDGRIARDIDELAKVHGVVVRGLLLDERTKVTATELKRLVELPLGPQDDALAELAAGRRHPALSRPRPPRAKAPEEASPGVQPVDAALEELFGEVVRIEQVAESLSGSGLEAFVALAALVESVERRFADLRGRLDALKGLITTTPEASDAAAPSSGDQLLVTANVPAPDARKAGAPVDPAPAAEGRGDAFGMAWWLHERHVPVGALSTSLIKEELEGSEALAAALAENDTTGLPLPSGQWVTVEELKGRARELRAELDKRTQAGAEERKSGRTKPNALTRALRAAVRPAIERAKPSRPTT